MSENQTGQLGLDSCNKGMGLKTSQAFRGSVKTKKACFHTFQWLQATYRSFRRTWVKAIQFASVNASYTHFRYASILRKAFLITLTLWVGQGHCGLTSYDHKCNGCHLI